MEIKHCKHQPGTDFLKCLLLSLTQEPLNQKLCPLTSLPTSPPGDSDVRERLKVADVQHGQIPGLDSASQPQH